MIRIDELVDHAAIDPRNLIASGPRRRLEGRLDRTRAFATKFA